jgi:hypothetical protein
MTKISHINRNRTTCAIGHLSLVIGHYREAVVIGHYREAVVIGHYREAVITAARRQRPAVASSPRK